MPLTGQWTCWTTTAVQLKGDGPNSASSFRSEETAQLPNSEMAESKRALLVKWTTKGRVSRDSGLGN